MEFSLVLIVRVGIIKFGWRCSVRRGMSLPDETLGPWFRILTEAWMSVFCVCVVLCG
jgi:hypothetical protein